MGETVQAGLKGSRFVSANLIKAGSWLWAKGCKGKPAPKQPEVEPLLNSGGNGRWNTGGLTVTAASWMQVRGWKEELAKKRVMVEVKIEG